MVAPLVEAGELQVVGIVQEQHPDRAMLFQQWKGLDFPILWDPFGVCGVDAVPDLTAVDEHGIVRLPRPGRRRFQEEFVEGFLRTSFQPPAAASGVEPRAAGDPGADESAASDEGPPFKVSALARLREGLSVEARGVRAAARLMLSGPGSPSIDAEVDALAAAARAGGAEERFRSGVGLRLRFDGPRARGADLQGAVDAWFEALMARPNQYVWRRRIQQWGPTLDKPYAFYDWVPDARAEVLARGGRPIPLRAPLSGSELAARSRAVPVPVGEAAPPDPEARITRDPGRLVRVEHAVALNTAAAGPRVRIPRGALRLHVVLRPRPGASWPTDAEPPVLWLEPRPGWLVASPSVRFPAPGEGGEQRPLMVDLEASTPLIPLGPPDPNAPPPPSEETLRGYVLYSACDAEGACLYRRQDFEAVVRFPAPPMGDGPPGDGGPDGSNPDGSNPDGQGSEGKGSDGTGSDGEGADEASADGGRPEPGGAANGAGAGGEGAPGGDR
jgi:hypothetical protein